MLKAALFLRRNCTIPGNSLQSEPSALAPLILLNYIAARRGCGKAGLTPFPPVQAAVWEDAPSASITSWGASSSTKPRFGMVRIRPVRAGSTFLTRSDLAFWKCIWLGSTTASPRPPRRCDRRSHSPGVSASAEEPVLLVLRRITCPSSTTCPGWRSSTMSAGTGGPVRGRARHAASVAPRL